MHDMLVLRVGYVVPLIELAGITIMLWGVLQGFAKLACRGWMVLRSHPLPGSLDDIRIVISEKLVLGLEFFARGRCDPDHRRAELAVVESTGRHRRNTNGNRLFPAQGNEQGKVVIERCI